MYHTFERFLVDFNLFSVAVFFFFLGVVFPIASLDDKDLLLLGFDGEVEIGAFITMGCKYDPLPGGCVLVVVVVVVDAGTWLMRL